MNRLTEFLALDAQSGDDRFPIRAIFNRKDTMAFSHAAVDIGGWLDRREVLVSIDRFGPPDKDGWPVSLTRDELESAPAFVEAGGWTEALPPIVVGPFGYTFSPLMMAAGLDKAAESSALPHDPEGRPTDLLSESAGHLRDVERSSNWIGRDAFGPNGSMGQIADMVVSDLTLTAAILEDGTELALSRLRHMAEQGHAVFD